MCGIAGWFRRDGGPVDPDRLRAMTDRLVHRGPDDSGNWTDGPIGLGHRRLSIRDLSASGRQPMCDPQERVFVTFNGEIYNDGELRRELEERHGFRFRTRTDTEIIPLGYLAWGDEVFGKLEGMFAIGLWDRAARRLVLARDGIGIKPLLYHASASQVVFGSEMKAILENAPHGAGVDPAALHTLLAAGFCGPGATLVTGVQQVRPGTVMSFSRSETSEKVFWRPTRTGEIVDEREALDRFCEILPAVVESQLVSDVPVSVFQSGGIDSTLVSLSLRRIGAKPPLFTASFREESHDESALAADVAKAAGLEQHLLPVDEAEDPAEEFRAIVRHFDGQCADTGSYAFYRLCGAVRKHSTVVLSGDGGDEFFGGYETYRASRHAKRIAPWMPASLMAAVGRAAYAMGAGNESRLPATAVLSRFALGVAAGGANAHMQWRRLVPAFLAERLYAGPMRPLVATSPVAEYEAAAAGEPGDAIDRWLLADQRFHLQSVLAKVDAMSMAHSLEVRVPLLDRRIMDFAGRCAIPLLAPPGGPGKRLLRLAATRLGAPASVTDARKRGFNVPIARLLRTDLAPVADRWLEREPDVLAPFLAPDAVRALWREHLACQTNHAYALWPVLTVAEWLGGSRPFAGR